MCSKTRLGPYFDFFDLGSFIIAGLLVNLVPGVDVAFAMGYGLVGGAKKGATAGLGVGLGVFFHIALTALGVGALLVAYEGSLYLLRLFGAAYLIYLGLITWQRAPNTRGSLI